MHISHDMQHITGDMYQGASGEAGYIALALSFIAVVLCIPPCCSVLVGRHGPRPGSWRGELVPLPEGPAFGFH